MDKWPEKYIIGLTGNIAVGKSVVRKMLEHVGAFGIDADALSNRAIQKGAPGYDSVVENFGRYILDDSGEIDRGKLGRIVFSDLEALKLLEAIVHPLVRQAIEVLIQKSKLKVVVIEAVKLLESPLKNLCDSIWVTTSDESLQIARLKKHRGMNEAQAKQRLAAQSTQTKKVAHADIVIHNTASIESTWEQVKAAWKLQFPEKEGETVPSRISKSVEISSEGQWKVARARPRQAAMIADFISENGMNGIASAEDVMEAFGSKAFLLLQSVEGIKALLGWKVENLIAQVDGFIWERGNDAGEIISFLSREVEEASRELQCEIILVFSDKANAESEAWFSLGYESMTPEMLKVGAWKEAALDSFKDNHVMYFKALRADRILRPM